MEKFELDAKTVNENIKEKSFSQLFNEISPEDISDDVFTLVGKELYAITAGDEEQYNSMVGSGGGIKLLPAISLLKRHD